MSSSQRIEDDGSQHRGRTDLSSRALHRLAAGLARDASGVHQRAVVVTLGDDSGALRVSVVIPALVTHPPVSIPDQSARVRSGVITGMSELAGRRVSAVDVRFTGVHHAAERRAV